MTRHLCLGCGTATQDVELLTAQPALVHQVPRPSQLQRIHHTADFQRHSNVQVAGHGRLRALAFKTSVTFAVAWQHDLSDRTGPLRPTRVRTVASNRASVPVTFGTAWS